MLQHELRSLSTANPLSVALYARVSSEGQAGKDLSIPAQIKALRDHANKQGWTIAAEFIDEALTGRTDQRPAFQEMIALAKRKDHPVDAILLWKFDRFARNREQAVIHKAILRRHRVQVLSLNEPLEDSPAGRLSEGMLESIAQFISENMASDIVRGQRENATRGFLNGGSPPFGYQRETILVNGVPRKRLILDAATAPIVRRIYDLALSGKGGHAIARLLYTEQVPYPTNTRVSHAVWNFYTVYRMLKNPVYTGTLIWGRRHAPVDGPVQKNPEHLVTRKENAHPAIVSEEEFLRVQHILASRHPTKIHPRSIHGRYLLTGLIRCAECGSPMQGNKGGTRQHRYYYYLCATYWRKGYRVCAGGKVRCDILDAAVLENLQSLATEEETLRDIVTIANRKAQAKAKDSSGKLERIMKQIADLDARLTRLYAALETGTLLVADLAPRIRTLQHQRQGLEQQRAAVQREVPAPVHTLRFEKVRTDLRRLMSLFASKPREEQKAALRSIVDQIRIERSENGVFAEIRYTLGDCVRRLTIQRGKADRGENGQYIRAVK